MRQEYDSFAGNPELNGSDSLIVVSGCSGGGKSTLIRELAKRGYDAVMKPTAMKYWLSPKRVF